MAITRKINLFFKVLTRRPLFRNYYGSFANYVLARYGLVRRRDIIIKCFDNSVMRIDTRVFGSILHLYVNNIVAGVDCLSNVIKVANGSLVPIDEFTFSSSVVEALRRGWAYDFSGRYWFKEGVKFKHVYWPIIEIFDLGQYSFLDVKNKVIIDIGSFVGDSAIYFALRGAKNVYAIEPHLGAYHEMLENIKLNDMENKIVAINAALGNRLGEIKASSIDIDKTGGMYYGPGSSGNMKVLMITLEQLIREYGIEPEILKMDCEGCEFDVILNDYENIRKFDELVFEYHSYAVGYSVTRLIDILKHDFECRFVNEEFYENYFKSYTRSELGMLHCINTSLR